MKIGITGQIGSGKSFILNRIKNFYHYPTISADDLVKDAYEDNIIKEKLDDNFHCLVNGKINKELLKKNLNDRYDLLNSIIHPYVFEKIRNLDDKNTIYFVEVPLLYETGAERLFDKIIGIDIDDSLRHQRLKERDPSKYNYYLCLEKRQLSSKEKCSKADYIYKSFNNDIDNFNCLNDIIKKIRSDFGENI